MGKQVHPWTQLAESQHPRCSGRDSYPTLTVLQLPKASLIPHCSAEGEEEEEEGRGVEDTLLPMAHFRALTTGAVGRR